jgi:CheY-like chemotaxis protein
MLFESEGYRVMSSSSGNEGLSTLRNSQIDLIITDVVMPNLNGIELIKTIQHGPGYQTFRLIPVIVISSHSLAGRLEGCRYEAFINKPFDLDDLLGAVQKALASAA